MVITRNAVAHVRFSRCDNDYYSRSGENSVSRDARFFTGNYVTACIPLPPFLLFLFLPYLPAGKARKTGACDKKRLTFTLSAFTGAPPLFGKMWKMVKLASAAPLVRKWNVPLHSYRGSVPCAEYL